MAEVLLELNEDLVDEKDNEGTPIMLSVPLSFADSQGQALVFHKEAAGYGIDVYARSAQCHSVLRFAIDSGCLEAVQLFLSTGIYR